MDKKKKNIIIVSSIIITLLLLALIIGFCIYKANRDRYIRGFYTNEGLIATSLAFFFFLDTSKPIVLMFSSRYCKFCAMFKPIFYKLERLYKNDYNFVVIDSDDPKNEAIYYGNVIELPSLYIFDPAIGNKIHITSFALHDEMRLRTELNNYLRIRSVMDIEQAEESQRKELSKYD